MTGELVDTATVLETRGPLATKRITWAEGEPTPRIEAYARAAHFHFVEFSLSGPDELVRLLHLLEQRPKCLIVRGKPKPGIEGTIARRLIRDRRNGDGSITPATLEACPHYWIALDCDHVPCPNGIDPLFEPRAAVEHVVSTLPVEFQGATCWWQFTASQGFKPGISLRLFSGQTVESPIGNSNSGSPAAQWITRSSSRRSQFMWLGQFSRVCPTRCPTDPESGTGIGEWSRPP